jgi:hypothetical protein
MNSFIVANLVISAYNLLWVLGMHIAMAMHVPCPEFKYVAIPWIGIGVPLYALVLIYA